MLVYPRPSSHHYLPSAPAASRLTYSPHHPTQLDQRPSHPPPVPAQLSYPTPPTVAAAAAAASATTDLDGDTYMSAYDFSSPAIRVQQSTPVPQLSAAYASSPLSAISGVDTQDWSMYSSTSSHLTPSPSLQTVSSRKGRGQAHQRGTSSSSAGSNGSPAQYTLNYPYVHSNAASPSTRSIKFESYQSADEAQRSFSNHLPTPSQTPTQDSFLATTFPAYSTRTSSDEPSMATHMALLDQNTTDADDLPGFGHSARQSVSSFGRESPATPHTSHGDDLEDKYKPTSNDVILPPTMPKLNRTMTDIIQDELYIAANAAHIPAPQSQQHHNQHHQQASSLLSPYRGLTERLQQAEQARSQSPASSVSREVSPFRQGAVHAPVYDGFGSPHPNLRASNHMQRHQQQHQNRGSSFGLKQLGKMEDAEPKTISPKEAMLDYCPDENESQVPLFPTISASQPSPYETQYSGATMAQNMVGPTPADLLGGGARPPQSNFTFTQQPAMPVTFPGMPQFTTSHHYRTAPPMAAGLSEGTPDFPAHLNSMESSCSEAGPQEPSSQHDSEIQRPSSTLADSGTYSCTYHGCLLRFDTPQKLQRHKRESHRNATNPPDIPAVGSGMTSAALLARNSQAGPHKCERINPTTGKPCNTIFSRPYDLTRHEDTIHNARKQKVRCALCVEEKTFSRNDALTRHMRVVHPEVDFPGKHRRRGGNHD